MILRNTHTNINKNDCFADIIIQEFHTNSYTYITCIYEITSHTVHTYVIHTYWFN